MASSLSSSATSFISTRPMRRFKPPIRIPIFLSEHSKPSSLSHHTTRSITTSTITTTRCQIRDLSTTDARKGTDILIEALEREGVMDVFTYPGGASLEIHHALMRSPDIRNHLLRHEHGASFGPSGYARSTGKTGVCVTAWGPDRANLVSALANALLDSVPMVAITGQALVRISIRMIGDISAYRDTPRVDQVLPPIISKHTYFVEDVDDIPRIIKEAFLKATSGTPGPVLVPIPMDIQI